MSPSAGRRARVHGRPGGPPAGGVAPRAPPWVFTHHKATASGFHPFQKRRCLGFSPLDRPRLHPFRDRDSVPEKRHRGDRIAVGSSPGPHGDRIARWVPPCLGYPPSVRRPSTLLPAGSRRLIVLCPLLATFVKPQSVSWAHPMGVLEGRFTSRCSTLSSLVASPSPSHLPLRRVCCPTPPLLSCPFLAALVTWGCFISLLFSRGVWRARRHRLCCCRVARPSSRGAVNPHGGALAYCHGGQLHRAAHPQWRASRHRRCRCRGSGRTLCRTTSSAASPLLRSTRWAAASCRSPSAG